MASKQTNPKRIWLITYGASSPNITHDMLEEENIISDECYTLEQRDLKYTLVNIPTRVRWECLDKCMKNLKESRNIILQNITGYDSLAGFYGPNEELAEHPGLKLIVHHFQGVHKWSKTGDAQLNKTSIMWKFITPADLSTWAKPKLVAALKEKTEELSENKRKLQTAESEIQVLEAELNAKQSENDRLQKRIKTLQDKVAAITALYNAASA
jgi:hypothetical protein